jgi:hypothetical protein
MAWSRSRWDQRRPQISPRRAPVVMVSQTSAPQAGSLDQARSTSRAASSAVDGLGVGVGQRRLVGVFGRVDRDPLPHDGPVEGAADDPVDLPDGRVGEPAAHVRLAGPPARVAAGRVGRHAGIVVVFVAAVRLAGPLLQVWSAVAVVPVAAELSVEGVQGFDVEPGQRQRPKNGPDVLADVALVAPTGRRVDVEDLHPLVEELRHAGTRTWVAFWSIWCRSQLGTFSARRRRSGRAARPQ